MIKCYQNNGGLFGLEYELIVN